MKFIWYITVVLSVSVVLFMLLGNILHTNNPLTDLLLTTIVVIKIADKGIEFTTKE